MSVHDNLSPGTAPLDTTPMDTTPASRAPVAEPASEPSPLLAHFIYALYSVGLVSGGIPIVIGVIMAYVKRRDTAGTWLESHYTWQIRTFWITLLVAAVGGLLTLVLIGWLVLAAGVVWAIYRIIKGWLRLAEHGRIDDPTRWL